MTLGPILLQMALSIPNKGAGSACPRQALYKPSTSGAFNMARMCVECQHSSAILPVYTVDVWAGCTKVGARSLVAPPGSPIAALMLPALWCGEGCNVLWYVCAVVSAVVCCHAQVCTCAVVGARHHPAPHSVCPTHAVPCTHVTHAVQMIHEHAHHEPTRQGHK